MKKLLKIMSTIPCYLKVNNITYFVENQKYLEIIDEEVVNISAFPTKMCEYFPLHYQLKSKLESAPNIRITKYNNNILMELQFCSANKVKFLKKYDFEINYYNSYYLGYENNFYQMENFNQNYYKMDIEKLNERYYLIKGHFKLNENKVISLYNEKIHILVFDTLNKNIVHFDSCSNVEIDKEMLKVTSFMFDQNKQALVCEFLLNNNEFIKKDFYSVYTKQMPTNLTKRYQINKAFFECILAQNTNLLASYLTDDLKSKVKNKNLHLMFNNFIKVDNEFLQNIDEINLINKVDENIYESTTYKIEYVNNKISNIIG